MRFTKLCFVEICLFQWSLYAQSIDLQVFASSEFTDNNYAAWTIGEPLVNPFANANLLISEGFHQPTTGTVGIDNDFASFGVERFPNPTAGRSTLRFSRPPEKPIAITLTSLIGQVVWEGRIPRTMSEFALDLSPFANGLYFLKLVAEDGHQSATLRLEKIDF